MRYVRADSRMSIEFLTCKEMMCSLNDSEYAGAR
jgi:hypothetical protein